MHQIAPTAHISPLCDLETSCCGSLLVVGEGVHIDSFVKIKFAGGRGDVVIGDRSYINACVVMYSGNGIQIGNNVLIAANTTLAATNHEYRDKHRTIFEQRFMPSKNGIRIDDDCWIGAGCVLLDGTWLKRGCVVGAGTVVRGEWPEYAVIAGEPPVIKSYRV